MVKIEGRRGVGRRQAWWFRNIWEWTEMQSAEQLFIVAKNKQKFAVVIANVKGTWHCIIIRSCRHLAISVYKFCCLSCSNLNGSPRIVSPSLWNLQSNSLNKWFHDIVLSVKDLLDIILCLMIVCLFRTWR